MEEAKQPLKALNAPLSASRLPVPRKRVLTREVSGQENEAELSVKRPKLAPPTVKTSAAKLPQKKAAPVKKAAALVKKAGPAKRPNSTTGAPLSRTQPAASTRAKVTKPKAGPASKSAAVGGGRGSGGGKIGGSDPMGIKGGAGAAKGATAAAESKPKRCGWDLKGRLQDMEEQMASDRVKFRDLAHLVKSLESERAEQEGTIRVKLEETQAASQRIKNLEEELNSTTSKYREASESLASLQRQHRTLEDDHTLLQSQLSGTKSALAQLTTEMSTIQCRYDAMKTAKEEVSAESDSKSKKIAELEEEVRRHLATITENEAKIRDDEKMRKKLHNTIQELKGNIRVFCRVRPFLPGESQGASEGGRGSPSWSQGPAATDPSKVSKLEVEFPDVKKIVLHTNEQGTSSTGVGKSHPFQFDRVFAPSASQESVFEEISQLVQSALDGYNVCIFAYGQTGSGKTFTMEGPETKSLPLGAEPEADSRGMIPRAVEQVFDVAMSLKEQGWEYKLEASFLEIYNETIRDLLSTSTSNPSSSSSSSSNSSTQHDIRLDPSLPGGVYVTNVSPILVTSQQEVANLLRRAARNRAVAATNCNERSSRSHSVFRLQLSGSNNITGEMCKGSLNLVDLAGSERLSQSGSVGDRQRETRNINKSLSNLGQVILALANKDSHVPYRNSKLTYLLQNSLGGNSKTLMFVNMSPLPTAFQQTLCSLRFATKVNQCNIGTAQKAIK